MSVDCEAHPAVTETVRWKLNSKETIFIKSLSKIYLCTSKGRCSKLKYIRMMFSPHSYFQAPSRGWHHLEVQEARGHEAPVQVARGQQQQVQSVQVYRLRTGLWQGRRSGWPGPSSDTSASHRSPPSAVSLRQTRGMYTLCNAGNKLVFKTWIQSQCH